MNRLPALPERFVFVRLVQAVQRALLPVVEPRFLEIGDGVVEPAGFIQELRHVVVGLGQFRIDRQCLLVAGHGLGHAALVAQRFTEIAVCFGIIGRECERIAIAGDGIVEPSLVAQCCGKIEMAARIALNRQRLAVTGDGFIQLALLLQYGAHIAVGFEETGLDGKRLAVGGNRFIETLARL